MDYQYERDTRTFKLRQEGKEYILSLSLVGDFLRLSGQENIGKDLPDFNIQQNNAHKIAQQIVLNYIQNHNMKITFRSIIKETKQHGTKIFMKYSLTNSNNVELGYHHIYSVDFQNNTLSNYFDAFTNKNTMEVVSYSVGADNLYFSFVNGLNVENYVIDLSTNNARRLETNRKMLDVFAF